MKSLLTLLLCSISFAASADRVDEVLKVDSDGEVRIEVISGKIVVEGWDKSEVRVRGNVSDKEQFIFKTSGRDTHIEVESEHGFWGGGRNSGDARLTINVPRNSSITTEGASSSYVITGVEGKVDATTMSGDLKLNGGSGKVELESVSGDVTVVGASGKLDLASVSGDVRAKVDAMRFEASSVSGNIEASIGKSERIQLQSVSGDIDLDVDFVNGGELDADTVSGDIDIRFLNKDLSASFEIETGPGGDIKNRITDDKGDSFMSFSGSLEFRVGKGKSSVDLETMSGTIRIDH